MQDFYKGQKFYYIDSRTHRKVYITLIAVKDDMLYFEGLNRQKYAVKKYYVNKTVFVSLLEEETEVKGSVKKYRPTKYWKHIESGKPGIQKGID